MKKLILYDLDGTLVDTREDIVRAANHMVTSLGHKALSAKEVSDFVGVGLRHLIKGCLKTEDSDLIDQGSKIYRDHYKAHMMDHSVLFPAALEMLEYFKDRKQAVVTNKPNPFAYDMLKALETTKYFFEVIPGNSQYRRKPSAEAVKVMMKQVGVGPKETLFVGDSAIDIETGKNAGAMTVALLHGFGSQDELQCASPDLLFPDLKAFLDYSKKAGI